MDLSAPNGTNEPNDTQKPKATSSKGKRDFAKKRLERFISEALQIDRAERKSFAQRFPSVPQEWPAWPYLDYGTVASTVGKELGNSKESVKEILWRLKRFQYPYPVSKARKPTTFYQHAKFVGILEDLLKPPLLWDIRSFWWSQRYGFYQKKLRNQKKSKYGHALAFHHELMYQLSAHLAEMEKLARRHAIKRKQEAKVWFERFHEYRRAVLRRLLYEAAVVYPEVAGVEAQRPLKPARQLGTKEEKIKAQVSLFEKFNSAIKQKSRKGRERHKFAYHLTSLICTPREIILKHRLRPTPVTVRKNIEGWKKTP